MTDIASVDEDQSPASPRSPITLPEGTLLREEYRVETVLGTGSFGITYKARDEHLGDPVAIKEYYPRHLAGRTEERSTIEPYSSQNEGDFAYGLDQFMQEGRRLARFEHPNIADVRSYFEENGTGYLVMDYYEGRTLAEHLTQSEGRLPEEEALDLIQDVLSGLQVVHDEGLLHRDIDPQNVYRTAGGTGILLDFGAAREAAGKKTQSLSVILKPGYAPIEQYSADGDQGPHTDVYACAATLYKCLTGLKPPEATERVQEDELVPPREVRPEISMETSVAVRKGLAVYPDQRPASAESFSALLGGTRTVQQATEVPAAREPTAQPTADEPTSASATPANRNASPSAKFTDETVPGSESEDGSSVWWGLGLAAGLAGLVGGTLLISDAGAVEVLAFFGTWLAVCAGLIGLFREGEELMSPEARASVTDWLLREDFAERTTTWPETFTTLFDAVFTKNHLSWTCFGRSAVASVAVVTIAITGMIGLGIMGPMGVEGVSIPVLSFILAILPIVAYNVLVDYVSLYETRWVLGKMKEKERMYAQVAYLGLDLLLTALIFIVSFLAIGSIVELASGGMAPSTLLSLEVLEVWKAQISGIIGFVSDGSPFTAVVISTFFTSVWIWLYVGAGGLLRVLHPVLKGIDWLKGSLDVEGRPVHTLGLLLAVLTTIAFAVSAPFVL